MFKKNLILAGLLFTSLPVNAALFQFSFSGLSDTYFGPEVPVTASFVLDTGIISYTNLDTCIGCDPLGPVTDLRGFSFESAASEFYAEAGNIWSMGGPVSIVWTSRFLTDDPYIKLSDTLGGVISFQTEIGPGLLAYPTVNEWERSPDPFAEYYLSVVDVISFNVSIGPIDNPDFRRGWLGGSVVVEISQVPLPATGYLLMTALIGVIARKWRSASLFSANPGGGSQ